MTEVDNQELDHLLNAKGILTSSTKDFTKLLKSLNDAPDIQIMLRSKRRILKNRQAARRSYQKEIETKKTLQTNYATLKTNLQDHITLLLSVTKVILKHSIPNPKQQTDIYTEIVFTYNDLCTSKDFEIKSQV